MSDGRWAFLEFNMQCWTFNSIIRLEQVLMRCLIWWVNHPGYTEVHQTMQSRPYWFYCGWVDAKGCLTVLFTSSLFLNREWDREVASGRKKPSLLRALARCFIRPFLLFGVLLYIGVSVYVYTVCFWIWVLDMIQLVNYLHMGWYCGLWNDVRLITGHIF